VIPFVPTLVTDSVKAAYMSEQRFTEQILVESGAVRAQRVESTPVEPRLWGDTVPAFRPRAFIEFDEAGRLWVQRATFHREGARYDVIGESGELIDRIRLLEGHRVAGFGRGVLYVVRRDAEHNEYLQRRRLPQADQR
jgi:hypothetical protein